ncbi:MAG: tRNA 2-thiouridine(34) synthase MnmA [Chlorobiaceae bacterium]|nr:tRNA 2-thiouridine(34) synthase MnmA [Chlorobiaceae bacterium]NTW74356.1 tRNA 2-thiouridine(34) synthase MnmA [Chlorobiaceae bacterium]
MNTEKKVVVGLSGGVDSAVAACILARQGYRVTGLNIRVLDEPDHEPSLSHSALRVSDRQEFSFPVFTLNLSGKFRKEVIGYFHDAYLCGKTPNPCMVCNKNVKWSGLLDAMHLLGADYAATGHYARTELVDGRHRLYKGIDHRKDQSYFLWMLGRSELSKTLFPLGGFTKPEVREMAREFGVLAAEKKESQEICFVPGDDYASYLSGALPGLGERVAGGEIVDREGKVIGHHRGYPFYTIGQRRGLGISTGEPAYVTEIDAVNNRIRIGSKKELECLALRATGLNWIGIDRPEEPVEASARIRYRDRESRCLIGPAEGDAVTVSFPTPKSAVAAGQAIVFYHEDEVLGGGTISGVINTLKT